MTYRRTARGMPPSPRRRLSSGCSGATACRSPRRPRRSMLWRRAASRSTGSAMGLPTRAPTTSATTPWFPRCGAWSPRARWGRSCSATRRARGGRPRSATPTCRTWWSWRRTTRARAATRSTRSRCRRRSRRSTQRALARARMVAVRRRSVTSSSSTALGRPRRRTPSS